MPHASHVLSSWAVISQWQKPTPIHDNETKERLYQQCKYQELHRMWSIATCACPRHAIVEAPKQGGEIQGRGPTSKKDLLDVPPCWESKLRAQAPPSHACLDFLLALSVLCMVFLHVVPWRTLSLVDLVCAPTPRRSTTEPFQAKRSGHQMSYVGFCQHLTLYFHPPLIPNLKEGSCLASMDIKNGACRAFKGLKPVKAYNHCNRQKPILQPDCPEI